MLITVIQTVIRIVGHRNNHVLHGDHGVHCPHGHHGHHGREQASAELEDRESLAVAAASVQDQDTEEGETFIERFDHHDDDGLDNRFAINGDHHDGLDNRFAIGGDHYDGGLDNPFPINGDHHDGALDNRFAIDDDHHDDGLDNTFAINGDHCRYSKGVSAVETILLVDRLRQQAFSHSQPLFPLFSIIIFYHYHHQQHQHHNHCCQQDRVNLTLIVRWQ